MTLDLKTELTNLMCYANLVQNDQATDDGVKTITDMQSMREAYNNVMNLINSHTGEPTDPKKRLDLENQFGYSVTGDAVGITALYNDLSINDEYEPKGLADLRRIAQIVGNILKNDFN